MRHSKLIVPYKTDYPYRAIAKIARHNPIMTGVIYFFISFFMTYVIGFFTGQLHGRNGLSAMYSSAHLVDNFNLAFLAPVGAMLLCNLYNSINNSFAILQKEKVIPEEYKEHYLHFVKRIESLYNSRIIAWLAFVLAIAINVTNYYAKSESWLGYNGGLTAIYGRIFVTINYSLIIFIVYKCAITVWASRKILKIPLLIRPLHPDRSGGLSPLGSLAISVNYFLVVVLVFITLLIMFDDFAQGNSIYIVMIISLYLFAPFSLFASLMGANRMMKESKKHSLERLSITFDHYYKQLAKGEDTEPYDLERAKEIADIQNLYVAVDGMPVWPFDMASVFRFVTSILIPFSVFIWDTFLRT